MRTRQVNGHFCANPWTVAARRSFHAPYECEKMASRNPRNSLYSLANVNECYTVWRMQLAPVLEANINNVCATLAVETIRTGWCAKGKTISTATSCARLCVKNTGQKPAAPPCSRGKDISICAVLSSQSRCHSLSVALQIDFWRLPVPAGRLLCRQASMAGGRARAAFRLPQSQNFFVDFLFRLDARIAPVACKSSFQPEWRARVPALQSDLPVVREAAVLPGRNQPSRV